MKGNMQYIKLFFYLSNWSMQFLVLLAIGGALPIGALLGFLLFGGPDGVGNPLLGLVYGVICFAGMVILVILVAELFLFIPTSPN